MRWADLLRNNYDLKSLQISDVGNFYLLRFKSYKTKFEGESVRAREREEKHGEKGGEHRKMVGRREQW